MLIARPFRCCSHPDWRRRCRDSIEATLAATYPSPMPSPMSPCRSGTCCNPAVREIADGEPRASGHPVLLPKRAPYAGVAEIVLIRHSHQISPLVLGGVQGRIG